MNIAILFKNRFFYRNLPVTAFGFQSISLLNTWKLNNLITVDMLINITNVKSKKKIITKF